MAWWPGGKLPRPMPLSVLQTDPPDRMIQGTRLLAWIVDIIGFRLLRVIRGTRLRVWIVDITGPPGTTLCRLGGPGVDGFIRPRQHVHFPC